MMKLFLVTVLAFAAKAAGAGGLLGNLGNLANGGASNALCSTITSQFQGKAQCGCSISLGSRTAEFDCSLTNPVCINDKTQGTFCAKPTYKGQAALASGLNVSSTVCSGAMTLNGASSIGPVPLENLCVNVNMCSSGSQKGGICSCSATYGSNSCSCSPCSAGTGITLSCNVVGRVVSLPVCTALQTPTTITGKTGSLASFIPKLLTSLA